MKNIFLFALIGGVILLLGCEKESSVSGIKTEQIYSLDKIFNIYNLKTDEIRGYYRLVLDFNFIGDAFCAPPPINCLAEVVVRPGSKQASTELIIEQERFELMNTFKDLYNQENVRIFFLQEDWQKLFTGLTDFCANEIIKGNLKLVMRVSSRDSNAEIYMVVDNTKDNGVFSKESVIGAVQIEMK